MNAGAGMATVDWRVLGFRVLGLILRVKGFRVSGFQA